MSPIGPLKQLLAGRWQLPAAAVALLALGTALYRVAPRPREAPIAALLADVHALVDADRFHDAANAVGNLLTMQPSPAPADAARLHHLMAEIIHRQEQLRTPPNRENLRRLLVHVAEAEKLAPRRDAGSSLRVATAHEWLGKPQDAITRYREALEADPTPAVRQQALQALIRLHEGRGDAREERRGWVSALLDDDSASPAVHWWAMRQALREALDADDVARARALVVGHADAFKRSDLLGYYHYLWAWVEVEDGRCEAAAPLVDAAEAWVESAADLQLAGGPPALLAALVRVLRGNVALCEERPQAALDAFAEAAGMQDFGDVLVDAQVGRMRALAALGRHDAAVAAPQEVLARLADDPPALRVAEQRFGRAAAKLHRASMGQDDVEAAVRYLTLAADLAHAADADTRTRLLESLGRTLVLAAERRESESARDARAAAGRAFEAAAGLCVDDDARYATLLWDSAGEYDAAGLLDDQRRALLAFVQHRLADPRLPAALLRLGQAGAVSGRLEEAVEWFGRLAEEFPQLEEAATARFLTAETLIAIDPSNAPAAEKLLLDLLRDDHVEPDARVFRDALFALCDLYYERGRSSEAISRIEDFLEFFPQDAERMHLRFLLADAYRRSAYELRAAAERDPASAAAATAEAGARLSRAAERFLSLAADLGVTGDGPDPSDPGAALYGRFSVRYAADCLYDQNTPETLDRALGLYRQVAARYQFLPDGLSAQVQMANIHLRQGRRVEAARAVERAHWMLAGVPDAALLADGAAMSRGDWEQFLAALRSSTLFEDVFARSP